MGAEDWIWVVGLPLDDLLDVAATDDAVPVRQQLEAALTRGELVLTVGEEGLDPLEHVNAYALGDDDHLPGREIGDAVGAVLVVIGVVKQRQHDDAIVDIRGGGRCGASSGPLIQRAM